MNGLKVSLSILAFVVMHYRNAFFDHDEILISYDVKELFLSIPISHTLKVLFDLLNKDDSLFNRTKLNPFHVTKLTSFCMREGNYFQFDEKFYKQVDGAPMGSPLSPALAEVFMESLERKAFEMVNTELSHDFLSVMWMTSS
ncbi:hypothetical protein M514_08586 [Trichuris suis]|nr:hypothetical protein M514_08586 [Trichuris suis]